MYGDSFSNEHEEVDMIHRKSRTKHKRRKTRKKKTNDNNLTYLPSPYIIGPKPPKTEFVTEDIVERQSSKPKHDKKNLLGNAFEYSDGRVYLDYDRNNLLQSRADRVFFGECLYDEEELAVLKSTKVWRLRKTGQRGLDKFRRTVEFLRFARKLCQSKEPAHLSQNETILFFLDTHPHEEEVTSELFFDITPFRSHGQRILVSSVKSVLEIPPDNRSENEINSILHTLRGFSKFSNYPNNIQKGLCRKGWYSRFDKSKILTREGSRAEFYYFILAGVAVSRCLGDNSDDRRRHIAEFHRQGDTLGEKEILTDTHRPATVVCKEPLEVLAVDREVLLDIFKSAGGLDCIDLLRSIPELSDFPLEMLQSYHFSCSVHSYRRGTVIVKNSIEAEWIYVVKSGSCQVYRVIQESKKRDTTSDCHKLLKQSSAYNLPNINNKGHLHSHSSENLSVKKKSNIYRKGGRRHDTEKLILPSISYGKNALTAMDLSEEVKTEMHSKKGSRKHNYFEKDKSDTDKRYAEVDIIAQRECFGLQSLIYDEVPQLSLVSNGAECVLISKQFFRDHITRDIRRKLQIKVLPYPDLSRLQDAVDDKRAWESYRRRVLKDYFK